MSSGISKTNFVFALMQALQTKAGHFEVIVNIASFYTTYMLITKIIVCAILQLKNSISL